MRSHSWKAHLLQQLQMLKKGTSTVTDLLHQDKSIKDNLTVIGYPLSEKDIVLSILPALRKEYDALYILVTSKSDSTMLDELHALLLT